MKKIKYKILLTSILAIATAIVIFAIWSENISRLHVLFISCLLTQCSKSGP